MSTERNPSFLKLLLDNHFHDKLKIPRAFLQNFQGNVPRQFHLRTPAGTWIIDVVQENYKFYLKKGWYTFVHENHIKVGDLLIFYHAGNLDFHVDIFGKNTCKKMYAVPEIEETDEEEEEEDGDDDNEDDDASLEMMAEVPPFPRRTKDESSLSSRLSRKIHTACSSGKAKINRHSGKRVYHLEKSEMKNRKTHCYTSEMTKKYRGSSSNSLKFPKQKDEVLERAKALRDEYGEEETNDADDDSIEILDDFPPHSEMMGISGRLHKRKRTSSSSEVQRNIKRVGGSSGPKVHMYRQDIRKKLFAKADREESEEDSGDDSEDDDDQSRDDDDDDDEQDVLEDDDGDADDEYGF